MRKRSSSAFTLVELVIVIAIVGILAAIAIPRFIDIRREAYVSQRDAIVGSVRAGILTVASKNQVATSPDTNTFPPDLEQTWGGSTGGTLQADGSTCAAATPCFKLVVPGGYVDSHWALTTSTTYTFTSPVNAADNKTYTYTQADGTFR